jgi:F0F1-type ATP synthase assembly protein I
MHCSFISRSFVCLCSVIFLFCLVCTQHSDPHSSGGAAITLQNAMAALVLFFFASHRLKIAWFHNKTVKIVKIKICVHIPGV